MGRQIIKQPDGLFSVWSTVIDDFIFGDASEEDIIEFFATEAVGKARKEAQEALERVKTLANPYAQFTMTWDECQEMLKGKL